MLKLLEKKSIPPNHSDLYQCNYDHFNTFCWRLKRKQEVNKTNSFFRFLSELKINF